MTLSIAAAFSFRETELPEIPVAAIPKVLSLETGKLIISVADSGVELQEVFGTRESDVEFGEGQGSAVASG